MAVVLPVRRPARPPPRPLVRIGRVLSAGRLDRTVTVDPDRHVVTGCGVSFRSMFGVDHNGGLFTPERVEADGVGLKLFGYADPDVHLFRSVGGEQFTDTGPPPD